MSALLTRDKFRESVFARDNHTCVFCSKPAVDAHHILERRLWPDGGYHIDNGASVCAEHHMACEMTTISVEEVLAACKIQKRILPDHLYESVTYDKWGNIVLENGTRIPGELFYDESVQKVLRQGNMLSIFRKYMKYPRTFHLPWSPGMHDDDRMLETTSSFDGQEVVITEKMDGENTTMYDDYIHARSVDGRSHASRAWVKNFWAAVRINIPGTFRICGENMYAKHSIGYDQLDSYFLGFSIWNRDVCLSWDETVEWFALLEIPLVKILYRGIYSEQQAKDLLSSLDTQQVEGYVLRVAKSFHLKEFSTCVGKAVRKGHIQTTKHWFYGQPIEPNKLKE